MDMSWFGWNGLDIGALLSISNPIVATLGIAALGLWWLSLRSKGGRLMIASMAALHVVALLSILAYFQFGHFRFDRYINPHDTFHYYIGAKYSQEVGYSRLYCASAAADREGRGWLAGGKIRDLKTYKFIKVKKSGAKLDDCKARFGASRWEEFKRDIEVFQSLVPKWKWQAMLKDKGYNATPAWTSVAKRLANWIPVDTPQGRLALVSVDLAWLCLMFAGVAWAFGYRAMLVAVAFLGINYFTSCVHIKGAFMRFDWLAALVLSVCAARKEHLGAAGVLLALSTVWRIFPAVFAFGPVVCLIFTTIKARRLDRKLVEFFVALGATLILFIAATAIDYGGIEPWTTFLGKMALHNGDLASSRVGFKYIFLHFFVDGVEPWRQWSSFAAARFDELAFLWWVIVALAFVCTGFVVRFVSHWEALCLGFVPFFFFFAPTFYYYALVIVPLLFFLGRVDSPMRWIGAGLLFVHAGVANFVRSAPEPGRAFSHGLSWSMLGLSVVMVACVLLEHNRGAQAFQWRAPRNWKLFAVGFSLAALIGALVFIGVFRQPISVPRGPAKTLVFVGDMMFTRGIERDYTKASLDCGHAFEKVSIFIQKADFAFGNLETAISVGTQPIEKRYTFNSSLRCAPALKAAGFDVLALANNHVLDYGAEGLRQTIANLEAQGLSPLGLSHDGAPQEPVIADLGDFKVGYLGYVDPDTPYAFAREFAGFSLRPAEGTRARIAQDIRALKKKVDVVVVSMHWGIEYKGTTPGQRALARYIVDAGAALIAGHHPHVQQEAQWHKNGLIIYSMGNFVFDQRRRPETTKSRLYKVHMTKDGVARAEYLPLRIEPEVWQPTPIEVNGWVEISR